MQINVSFDSSVATAPPAFKATVAAVEAYYDAAIASPVTIDIAVGYGEMDGQPVDSPGESGTTVYSYPWSQIRQALAAHATTAAEQAAVAALPTADPSAGAGFAIPAAEANLLGLSSTIARGFAGFGNTVDWNFDTTSTAVPGELDCFGVVAHEFSEIMGRVSGVGDGFMSVLDLFRYSGPGTRVAAAGGTAYFSLDGGTTDLANFNTVAGGDQGDWASSVGNDAFDAFTGDGVANPVSSADLAVLAALGYALSPSAAPTAAAVNPATTTLPDVSGWLTPESQSILASVIANMSPAAPAMNVVQAGVGASAARSVAGQLNALVVNAAAAGTSTSLPTGYTVGYLLGGVGASLSDANGASLLVATAADGTVEGDAGDTLLGGNGNETLVAGAGAETLIGGTGGSLFRLGAGADSVMSEGADTILGGAGTATIAASGAPMIFGGTGKLDFLGAGGAPTLIGGGAETVSAGAASALVFACGGAPLVVIAGSGASTVVAGAGGDVTLTGGTGPLLFFGGGATSYTPGAAVDTVVGGGGSLTATGGANGTVFFGGAAGGNRIASGTGAATIIGGGDGDVLTASGPGAHVIAAAAGAATIDGSTSSGRDTLFGGSGSDCIVGGGGSTAIVAGGGNDTLVAGTGVTLFTLVAGGSARADLIVGFNPAIDFVQLDGYAPDTTAAALAIASVTGGSMELALSDGTQITFQGVSGLSASVFM